MGPLPHLQWVQSVDPLLGLWARGASGRITDGLELSAQGGEAASRSAARSKVATPAFYKEGKGSRESPCYTGRINIHNRSDKMSLIFPFFPLFLSLNPSCPS